MLEAGCEGDIKGDVTNTLRREIEAEATSDNDVVEVEDGTGDGKEEAGAERGGVRERGGRGFNLATADRGLSRGPVRPEGALGRSGWSHAGGWHRGVWDAQLLLP